MRQGSQLSTPKRASASTNYAASTCNPCDDGGVSSPPPRVTSFSDRDVTELVRSHWHADAEPATWVGSGAWSDCFAFDHAGSNYVVRLGTHVEDFAKDHVAVAFRSTSLPIPTCSEPVALGNSQYLCISERVDGIALERVAPWSQIAPDFVRLLEALRSVDTSTFSGWGMWKPGFQAPFGSWREFLLDVAVDHPGRISGWRTALDSNPTCKAAFEQGFERLQSIATNDAPRSLVHNDLLNRNVHVLGGKITGVFDWGNSLVGDHLYDLGLLCFWEPWLEMTQPELVIDGLRSAWAKDGYDCSDFDQRLQACLLHNGLGHIAYHASRYDWRQAAEVADRIEAVRGLSW